MKKMKKKSDFEQTLYHFSIFLQIIFFSEEEIVLTTNLESKDRQKNEPLLPSEKCFMIKSLITVEGDKDFVKISSFTPYFLLISLKTIGKNSTILKLCFVIGLFLKIKLN